MLHPRAKKREACKDDSPPRPPTYPSGCPSRRPQQSPQPPGRKPCASRPSSSGPCLAGRRLCAAVAHTVSVGTAQHGRPQPSRGRRGREGEVGGGFRGHHPATQQESDRASYVSGQKGYIAFKKKRGKKKKKNYREHELKNTRFKSTRFPSCNEIVCIS